jgi:NAD(P)-dependent dehydrogenase (short-subunit alcohol dehydrogenase family)
LDVSDDTSVTSAAASLKEKNTTLYALVNNAGVGLKAGGDVLNVNFYGPKRVTDAFVDLVKERIVNVSSGSASMWLRDQDEATKNLFTSSVLHPQVCVHDRYDPYSCFCFWSLVH